MKTILVVIFFIFCSTVTFPQLSDGSYRFDGIQDVITVPNNPLYSPGLGDITVEAWIKVDNLFSSYPIISNFPSSGLPLTGFRIYTTPTGIIAVYFGSQQAIAANIHDTCFHHIAAVRSGTIISIYIDGNYNGGHTDTLVGNINNNVPLLIGRDVGGVAPSFKGILKEVRLWKSARSRIEINSLMNDTIDGNLYPDLIGYWRCDDNSQIIHDYSSTANNGVLGNDTSVEQNDPTFLLSSSICGTPTEIIENQENTFNFFINATNEVWNIQLDHPDNEKVYLLVYDLTGKLIYSKFFRDEISFGEEFPKGIYIAKFISPNKSKVFRLVKN